MAWPCTHSQPTHGRRRPGRTEAGAPRSHRWVLPQPSPSHLVRLLPQLRLLFCLQLCPNPRPQSVSLVRRTESASGRVERAGDPHPARAGTRARAAWAAGSLAGRTWLALLCLQPLPPDSLINDPQRPGLCTGQQPRGCGSGQMDLPAVPPLLLGYAPRWAERL